jgi:hypothetical protein
MLFTTLLFMSATVPGAKLPMRRQASPTALFRFTLLFLSVSVPVFSMGADEAEGVADRPRCVAGTLMTTSPIW